MARLANMSATELALREEPPSLLPMEPEKAHKMMTAFRELCESILGSEDVIGIPGQPGGFVKRSGWSKLATFYSVTTTILHQEVERGDWRDVEDVPVRARAVVRAASVKGRHADGDGACAITEPRFKHSNGRQKIEHDLPATAVTRATNRAISNLIGFGSVSAEEVDGDVDAGKVSEPFGPRASAAEEDGLLRALDDLGATAGPVRRLIDLAGYLPRVGALSVMYTAAELRDRARAAAERMEAEDQEEDSADVAEHERDVVEDVLATDEGEPVP